MKTILCLSFSVCVWAYVATADYLDPQGPPGSTITKMPTLTQIEPRQVIESLPYTITNSGPYILTQNLKGSSGQNGIVIQADSVSINMNGFSLNGVGGSGSGIAVSGSHAFIVIKNGVISGWGQCGINAGTANHSKIEDLLVSGNTWNGVVLGTNCAIQRCTAANNGLAGFTIGSDCTILDSTAKANGGTGFDASTGCVIQRCVADQNSLYGFNVESLGQLASCTASQNSNNGFNLQHSCSVLDSCAYRNWSGFSGWDGIVFSRSVAYSNKYGFYAAMNCSFSDCSAYSNYWQGIYGDAGCSIANCTSYGNYDGIGASGGSKITGSSANQNRGNGFWLGPATFLQGCSAVGNSNGVAAQTGSYVADNEINSDYGVGIIASTQCRIANNHIVSCGTGIQLTGVDNVLSGNTLLNNSSVYSMSASNQLDLLVSDLPATISWPSKVMLSGSLKGTSGQNGINIQTGNVSVDLNGHALIGVPGSYDGISVAPGCASVTISNGKISQWGSYAIDASNAFSMKVAGIQAISNGFSGATGGIVLGSNSLVRECQIIGSKTYGLYVNDGSTIADSVFNGNGANGVTMTRGCAISDCVAFQNGFDGIKSGFGGTIQSCISSTNADDGIYADTGNQVLNNTCDGNHYGIELSGTRNTADGNSVTRSVNYGFWLGTGKNLIIRNRTSGNTINYHANLSFNAYGPTNTVPAGPISSTSPWANLDF